jgi:hypothetical protein
MSIVPVLGVSCMRIITYEGFGLMWHRAVARQLPRSKLRNNCRQVMVSVVTDTTIEKRLGMMFSARSVPRRVWGVLRWSAAHEAGQLRQRSQG